MEDNDLLADFVIEAKEHLADVENQFLAIEEGGSNVDVDLVNEVFRAIHSIKGAAGFLGLTKVNDLAHNLENVLNMMRNQELVPTSEIVDVMLRAADTLTGMIDDVSESESADIDGHVSELATIADGNAAPAAGEETPAAEAPAEVAEPAAAPAPEPTAEAAPASELSIDEQIEAAFAAKRAEREARKAAAAPAAATPTPAQKPAEQAAPAKPATEKAGGSKSGGSKANSQPTTEANIRVSVGVLDSLMNLAGELVLSRNQLLQAISREEQGGLEAISARLDQVTSELQEAIMQTRMQQIGTVFGKFPRVVRDLSGKLGKKCNLEIEGKEVEVDKTIVEAIGDPLTHLIRNSVDHGVESPADRRAKGKPEEGTISLRAYYQAGKVRIEIEDDGGGIDPNKLKEKALSKGLITQERADQMSDRDAVRLIFAPGFSTAKEVTDVSGRGVGMDVVRTNIAKLGGTVDVESVLGEGTNMVVTLPLTLAIIPSLIVQVGRDRFAIPQVNIAELVRIRESERETKLGRVKEAEVLRLRGSLLPLVRLSEALGCEPRDEDDSHGATNVIVVDTGQTRFGLVVDALHDSEEIVVKPLGRHHNDCRCLAGATILGDGHVALILDIAGLAADADLSSVEEQDSAPEKGSEASGNSEDMQSVLLFNNSPSEQFAIPMDIVARIERIRSDQIDMVGGREVLQYKSTTLTLMRLEHHINALPSEELERVYVVVFEAGDREIGLIAPHLKDIRDVPTNVDTVTFREPGVMGSLVIEEQATRLVDLFGVAEIANPEWFADDEMDASPADDGLPPLVLLAEDSGFFRAQVQEIVESKGYRVEPCEDGEIAWQKLESGEYDISLVLTDIEMPNLNGFDLCRRIKQTPHLMDLPVIALTSLAGTADIERGIEVGVDDYQIKMDREKLVASLKNFCDPNVGTDRNKKQPELVGSH